jgi:hypothetical protein
VRSGFLLLLLSGVVLPGVDGPKTPPIPAGPERMPALTNRAPKRWPQAGAAAPQPGHAMTEPENPSRRMFTAGLRSGQCRCVIMWREKVSLEVNRI